MRTGAGAAAACCGTLSTQARGHAGAGKVTRHAAAGQTPWHRCACITLCHCLLGGKCREVYDSSRMSAWCSFPLNQKVDPARQAHGGSICSAGWLWRMRHSLAAGRMATTSRCCTRRTTCRRRRRGIWAGASPCAGAHPCRGGYPWRLPSSRCPARCRGANQGALLCQPFQSLAAGPGRLLALLR